MYERIFPTWFMGGFECASHVGRARRRLDLIASTRHDRFVRQDYARLRGLGMRAARDGVRWHLVEARPGRYDFSGVRPMLRAARDEGITVIWDLLHYGLPDGLDPFSAEFVERFRRFAAAFVELAGAEAGAAPFVSPVNEISFFAWSAGDQGNFFPYGRGRGDELKRQLARAAIAACAAARAVDPRTRLVHTDPLIHVAADERRPEDRAAAEGYGRLQFAAWDMIAGRACPELGGSPAYLDVVGVNYYINNQWVYPGGAGTTLEPTHPSYRPLSALLAEAYARYRRPLLLAETGIEGEARGRWLRYVGREARDALRAGVDLQGLCLYPVVNHPGWDDDRHCHNGLWGYPDESGDRSAFEPLARELERQTVFFDRRLAGREVDEPDRFAIGELRLGAAARHMADVSSHRDGDERGAEPAAPRPETCPPPAAAPPLRRPAGPGVAAPAFISDAGRGARFEEDD
ncbi:MAG TPA: hypothetical protein VFS43_07165 [Polyangiaceae bacterium]|nr:hypothetical protein [Polyangiaceae bacterium]